MTLISTPIIGAYDLQIVKHDQIDHQNYYTMSRAGVTHFYHTETDFTSLDQWEREYFLYTKMMEIPFFKKFSFYNLMFIYISQEKCYTEFEYLINQSKM